MKSSPKDLKPLICCSLSIQLQEFYGKTKLLEVISVDAGMVSKSNAQGLIGRGLHYIMGIKGCQPTLFSYAQGLFGNKLPDCTTEECYNGKQVTRHLSRAEVLQAPAPGWEHITEFWKIETITLDPVTQHSSSEIRYFATSFLPSTLNNKEVLQAIRAHWGIENNANWCFDVHWKEDTAPWTSRAVPLVSYLRMIAYNIIERLKTRRLKAARNRVLGWKDFFKFFEHALSTSLSARDLRRSLPGFHRLSLHDGLVLILAWLRRKKTKVVRHRCGRLTLSRPRFYAEKIGGRSPDFIQLNQCFTIEPSTAG